jgi:hypothetical protein
VAALPTSDGAADSARAIVACVDSFELDVDGCNGYICRSAPEATPTITRVMKILRGGGGPWPNHTAIRPTFNGSAVRPI